MNAVAIVETIALVSILTRYLSPIEYTLLDQRLQSLEHVCRLFHATLARIGCPLYAQSLYYFWQACSQAIWSLEVAMFPGQPTETPTHIGLPNPCQSLSILQRADFDQFVTSIRPSWIALTELGDYLDRNYERNQNVHIFQVLDDVILMTENIATIRGIRLLNDNPFEAAPNVPAAPAAHVPAETAAPVPDPIQTELDPIDPEEPVLPDSGSTP
eukprot:s3138_g5.t1